MIDKARVPETRIKAVQDRMCGFIPRDIIRQVVNAFAEDLSERPIVPTDEQVKDIIDNSFGCFRSMGAYEWIKIGAIGFQRRLFRAPEPDPNDAKFQAALERYCGSGANFEMKAGFQRGWLAATEKSLPEPNADEAIEHLLEVDGEKCFNTSDHNRMVREALQIGIQIGKDSK